MRRLSVAAPEFQSPSIDISIARGRMEEHGQSLRKPAFEVHGMDGASCRFEIAYAELVEDGGQVHVWPISDMLQTDRLVSDACIRETLLHGPPIRPPAKTLRVYLRRSSGNAPIDIALAFGKASPAEAAAPPVPLLAPECAALQRCCDAWRAKSEEDAAGCDETVQTGNALDDPAYCQSELSRYAKEGACGQ